MSDSHQNLSDTERTLSALAAVCGAIIGIRAPSRLIRVIGAAATVALVVRSVSGYCAVKARMSATSPQIPRNRADAAIDESGDQSFPASDPPGFPASDPPASHLPDEPCSIAFGTRCAGQASPP